MKFLDEKTPSPLLLGGLFVIEGSSCELLWIDSWGLSFLKLNPPAIEVSVRLLWVFDDRIGLIFSRTSAIFSVAFKLFLDYLFVNTYLLTISVRLTFYRLIPDWINDGYSREACLLLLPEPIVFLFMREFTGFGDLEFEFEVDIIYESSRQLCRVWIRSNSVKVSRLTSCNLWANYVTILLVR